MRQLFDLGDGDVAILSDEEKVESVTERPMLTLCIFTPATENMDTQEFWIQGKRPLMLLGQIALAAAKWSPPRADMPEKVDNISHLGHNGGSVGDPFKIA